MCDMLVQLKLPMIIVLKKVMINDIFTELDAVHFPFYFVNHCCSANACLKSVLTGTETIALHVLFMPPPNILWLEAKCFCPVCPCVHPKALFISCRVFTHFRQTYINDALWDTDEHVTILGQLLKVTVTVE